MSEIDEYLRQRERPGSQPHPEYPAVVSTPQQILTGLSVGLPTLEAYCACCDASRGEGETLVVYVYRGAEAYEWDIARVYCWDCAPVGITTPTLGTTEALVSARLGVVSSVAEQTHCLCLTAPELVAHSPPTEGSLP